MRKKRAPATAARRGEPLRYAEDKKFGSQESRIEKTRCFASNLHGFLVSELVGVILIQPLFFT
jgi:hypothetical protein